MNRNNVRATILSALLIWIHLICMSHYSHFIWGNWGRERLKVMAKTIPLAPWASSWSFIHPAPLLWVKMDRDAAVYKTVLLLLAESELAVKNGRKGKEKRQGEKEKKKRGWKERLGGDRQKGNPLLIFNIIIFICQINPVRYKSWHLQL